MTLMKSTAATEPAAFTDLMPLFIPRTQSQELFAEAISRGVAHDEMLDTFWQRLRNYSRDRRDLFAEPMLDRLWELCARPEVSNIIGQSYSTFNVYDAIKERKILLVNLSGLGDETASILGSLIMLSLWDAVVAGAADPAFPTFLYLDEFQEFLNLPIAPDMMLAQARKYGLSMHLAHQQIGQLTTPMLSAIMANARSKVVFQTSAIDARALVREYGSLVSEADFTQLRNYEVICRLVGDDGVSGPITGVTLPPPRRVGLAKQIREYSRKRYAKPVAQVEAEIRARRENAAMLLQKRPRPPKVGETKWE